MGMFGKVMAISTGVFLGGGIGLYLRETYFYRRKKEQCQRLEEKLKELRGIRKHKERLLEDYTQISMDCKIK